MAYNQIKFGFEPNDTEPNMEARDVVLRYTDKDGQTWLQVHRVWDVDLFLERQHEAAVKEGGSVAISSMAALEREQRGNR